MGKGNAKPTSTDLWLQIIIYTRRLGLSNYNDKNVQLIKDSLLSETSKIMKNKHQL